MVTHILCSIILSLWAFSARVEGQCSDDFSCRNNYVLVPNTTTGLPPTIQCGNFSCWNTTFDCPFGCTINCTGSISCISIKVSFCDNDNCVVACTSNVSCWSNIYIDSSSTDFSNLTTDCPDCYGIRDLSNFDKCRATFEIFRKFGVYLDQSIAFCNDSLIMNIGPRLADIQVVLPPSFVKSIRQKQKDISKFWNYFWSQITQENRTYSMDIYDEGLVYFSESEAYKCALCTKSLNATWVRVTSNNNYNVKFLNLYFDCPITKIAGKVETPLPIDFVISFAKSQLVLLFQEYFFIYLTTKDFEINTKPIPGTAGLYDFEVIPFNPCYLPAPSYTQSFLCSNGKWLTTGSVTISSSILANSLSPILHNGNIVVEGNFTVDSVLTLDDLLVTDGVMRINNTISIGSCAKVTGGTLYLTSNSSSLSSSYFMFKQNSTCDINNIKFNKIFVNSDQLNCPVIAYEPGTTSLFVSEKCDSSSNYNHSTAVIVSSIVVIILVATIISVVAIKKKFFKRRWGDTGGSNAYTKW